MAAAKKSSSRSGGRKRSRYPEALNWPQVVGEKVVAQAREKIFIESKEQPAQISFAEGE